MLPLSITVDDGISPFGFGVPAGKLFRNEGDTGGNLTFMCKGLAISGDISTIETNPVCKNIFGLSIDSRIEHSASRICPRPTQQTQRSTRLQFSQSVGQEI
jgi:hypothetical protein